MDNTKRDNLILEGLELAVKLAKSRQSKISAHVELSDLVHAATMGLVQAASGYDGCKGASFRTYATRRISGAISDFLRSADHNSRSCRTHIKILAKAIEKLTIELGRNPCDSEVKARSGLTEDQWLVAMLATRYLASTTTPLAMEEAGMKCEIACPAPNPEELAQKAQMAAILNRAQSSIGPRLSELLQLYYYEEKTMKEIGDIMGIAESRVSQLHRHAIDVMRLAISRHGRSMAVAA